MKKVLFALMMMSVASILSAADVKVYVETDEIFGLVFSRSQFQSHRTQNVGASALTVPLIYKGSPSFNGWTQAREDEHTCEVDKQKNSFEIFMSICQPCIDCFPCEELPLFESGINTPATIDKIGNDAEVNPITRWNLYIVKRQNTDVNIYKINLLDDKNAMFFTGSDSSRNGTAYIQYFMNDDFKMSQNFAGKKNNFKFAYYESTYDHNLPDTEAWVVNSKKKTTAYIKSISSMNGTFACSWESADKNSIQTGNLKLTRNASLTSDAVRNTFTAHVIKTTTTTITNPNPSNVGWEGCGGTTTVVTENETIIPAINCETYIDDGNLENILMNVVYKNKNVTFNDEDQFIEYFSDFINL